MVVYRKGEDVSCIVENRAVACEYARSKSARLREAAARSPITAAADLSRLVRDAAVHVSVAAAENPKTPATDVMWYVVDVLARRERYLSEGAACSVALPAWFLEETILRAIERVDNGEKDVSVSLGRLIESPNISERTMLNLVENKRTGYSGFADNAASSARVLHLLSADSDRGVRYRVARREDAPSDVLVALACDSDGMVSEGALLNKSLPEYAFDQVIVRDVARADKFLQQGGFWRVMRSIGSNLVYLMVVDRLAPPYANKEEERAFGEAHERAKECLRYDWVVKEG